MSRRPAVKIANAESSFPARLALAALAAVTHLTDPVRQLVLLEVVADVFKRDVRDVPDRLAREKRLVRSDENIRECQQSREYVVDDRPVRAILEEVVALLLVDVEAGSADLAVLERFDERSGVDQLAAARVDDVNSRFHHGDRFAVEGGRGARFRRGDL